LGTAIAILYNMSNGTNKLYIENEGDISILYEPKAEFYPKFGINVALIAANSQIIAFFKHLIHKKQTNLSKLWIGSTIKNAFQINPHVIFTTHEYNKVNAISVVEQAAKFIPGVPVYVLLQKPNPFLNTTLVEKGAYDILLCSDQYIIEKEITHVLHRQFS
jgi:hypothetical protein